MGFFFLKREETSRRGEIYSDFHDQSEGPINSWK